jgi:dipeptidyl-peptidase-4
LDASFLRLYAETRGFMLGRPVSPKPTPDGKAVLFLRAEPKVPKLKLYEFDVASGHAKELLSPEAVLKGAEEKLSPEEKARRERMRVSVGGFTSFQLSDDGKLILLSLSGKLYVVTRADGSVRELETGPGTILDPKFNPDGSMVAYVRDHDVNVYDLTKGKAFAVTKGGTEKVTHGLAEFVAQEEMGRFSGYWWSPDSKFIAFEEADHEGVEQWFVADPAKPDQPPLPQYYPRPGKKNVAVRLGIIPVTGGETVWVDWDRQRYEYLASVHWDQLGPLTIQVQDRKQQELLLLKVDPATGRTTELLREKDEAFLNLHQSVPQWLPENDGFLWIGDFEGRRVLVRATPDGKKGTVMLPSDADVEEVVTYNPKSGRVIFKAYTAGNPTSNCIGNTRLDQTLSTGVFVNLSEFNRGTHDVSVARDHSAYTITDSTLWEMPVTRAYVFNAKHFSLDPSLPSVAVEPGFKPNINIQKVGDYWTAIVRPQKFDPKKKYPVIVDVYGGPKHLTVIQAMRPWLLMQWLADQGFIVVAIDNRGTPGRGKEWERAIYQKFGSVPLDDQVAGLKLLGEKFPEMDLERVGIVGWSFGGYMSALAVLKRPDIFKAAVAGAPVTDWEDYDTHYTERYLGLLPAAKKAYEEASLLPLAPKLERPLLLVHGTADDNVYFRHTLRLTDALFRAGKEFEVLPLPSLTHMVPDPVVTERLWTRIAGHFKKHLGEVKGR